MVRCGKLFIISGPAGIGKNTVVNALLTHISDGSLARSVTATTRPPRKGEIDGKHYHFISKENFLSWIGSGAFLEYALVHGKHYYGSLKKDVLNKTSKGIDVILVIDVQGFLQIINKNLDIDIVSIFIEPENFEVLEERMHKRGSENNCEIENRLCTFKNEISFASRYKYVIVSNSQEHDFSELLNIYTKEKHENNGR
ncbi:MAG: guanylate kinase [Puniceicoccales bacterium]|jgi:guanylate kinase|nr:guanylate kinase [Puniceicoccales bacterium]